MRRKCRTQKGYVTGMAVVKKDFGRVSRTKNLRYFIKLVKKIRFKSNFSKNLTKLPTQLKQLFQ